MTVPLYEQDGFRGREDVPGVTWIAAENTDFEVDRGTNFRLRIEIGNTNNKPAPNKDFDVWYSRNGGAYSQVNATNTYIRPSLSDQFADGDADSVDRLTTSSRTFTAGELDELGLCGNGGWLDFVGNDHMEVEYCMQFTASCNNGDYFDFQARETSVLLSSYIRTPRVTVSVDINRGAQASWVEIETPTAPRSGEVSWLEFEVPTSGNEAWISWAEFETPDAAVYGQVSWSEIEVPSAPRGGEVAWAETEFPTAPRQAQSSWTEFEIPTAPRSGQVSWTEFELPPGPRQAQSSWLELETPMGGRASQLSWSEFEIPTAPRECQSSWLEWEVPPNDREAELSWAEIEVPGAPAQAWLSWAVFETMPKGEKGGVRHTRNRRSYLLLGE